MASKIKNLLKKVKSNTASGQKYVPGATLNKPTLPSIKTLGITGANLVGSVLPGVKVATQVYSATKPKTTSTQTPLPRNYSSVPYNPNVPNMSVVPKAATTQFQTLNRLEGQMQTPNPDYGMYQTPVPAVYRSGGSNTAQPIQQTGPVAYNRNYSSSNNTTGSSTAPVGSYSPMSRSSISSSPTISRGTTISPAGVTTPTGATTGGTLNTPDGATTQYDYSLTPEERALEEARKRETEYYNKLANERISRDEIMRDTLAQFQGEIDATNAVFADKLRAAQIQGQNRLGMTRAENFNAGIQNSSFANAAQDRTINANMDAENAIQNEKLQMLSQIESNARAAGQAFYEQKKAAKEAGLESYMAALTGAKTAKEAIATDIADNILNSNLAIEEISNESLNKIAKEAGVTTAQIKKFYKQREEELAQAAAEEAKKGQFNLSEGQARYDAQGNLIASRAKTYAPKSGGEGSTSTGGIYDQLDYRTANTVIAQANQFGTSDIVNKYNNIIAASNLISGVDPYTDNPAEHQAVIYNFAKALDPDSVVREGEYATVKKYSQSLINKYGGEIRQAIKGTGFLSPGAIQAIQQATDNRIKAYEPQYLNLRAQTAQRINTLAGKPVADQVLLDYEQGYVGNQTPQSGGTDFSYLADKIRISGNTAYLSRAEWDNVVDKDALLAEAAADGYELLID